VRARARVLRTEPQYGHVVVRVHGHASAWHNVLSCADSPLR